jgi:hypothetical protein
MNYSLEILFFGNNYLNSGLRSSLKGAEELSFLGNYYLVRGERVEFGLRTVSSKRIYWFLVAQIKENFVSDDLYRSNEL